MAGPGDEMAAGLAGRGPMRASHADREQVIEALKDAFVYGRLTKDELDARAGLVLAARTCAELDAAIVGIPPARAASGSARPLVPARRRPLVKVAAGSGGCLALAAAAVGASFILDPGGPGVDRPWAGLMLLLAQYAVIAGVWILWSGVMTTSVRQRRSGRQLPSRPWPGSPRPPCNGPRPGVRPAAPTQLSAWPNEVRGRLHQPSAAMTTGMPVGWYRLYVYGQVHRARSGVLDITTQ
jgi:Domain of unknown function (DUF1707)